jgi:hypothetical protein
MQFSSGGKSLTPLYPNPHIREIQLYIDRDTPPPYVRVGERTNWWRETIWPK